MNLSPSLRLKLGSAADIFVPAILFTASPRGWKCSPTDGGQFTYSTVRSLLWAATATATTSPCGTKAKAAEKKEKRKEAPPLYVQHAGCHVLVSFFPKKLPKFTGFQKVFRTLLYTLVSKLKTNFPQITFFLQIGKNPSGIIVYMVRRPPFLHSLHATLPRKKGEKVANGA